MTFGIDLGTTNSIIGYGEDLFSGLVSSNVDIVRGKQVTRDTVGDDIVSSYKINMSTENSGKTSIQCSSVILRELADMATRRSGEECKDVIISVPFYFSHIQREAVVEAAKLAGLTCKGLINEPTAAALYTCSNIRDLVIVYDLGGGTFDVSIVDSRVNGYQVVATDGIVLGGDDLDNALVKDVIDTCRIPLRFQTPMFRKKLKSVVRLAKEEIQKTQSNVHVDLSELGVGDISYVLTVKKYVSLVEAVFGVTIEMTQQLIMSNLSDNEHPKITYVGGSSNCPFLRDIIRDQLELEEVSSDVSPDYTVAKGVAYYAKLFDDGVIEGFVSDVTKRLSIEDKCGKTIQIIANNTTIPCSGSILVHNSDKSDELRLRLYQGDSILAANNDYVGTMKYRFDRVLEPGEAYVEVTVNVDRNGVILLSAEDLSLNSDKQEVELVLHG